MALTHKSINVREEVWRRLRINAELTGVPVRDFLTLLIQRSEPIPEDDAVARQELVGISISNEQARQQTQVVTP